MKKLIFFLSFSSLAAINVTIADSIAGLDQSVGVIYRKFVAREKSVELKCKAPVPNAQMTW